MTAWTRTRPDGAVELRVNGLFVMDDEETTSARALARTGLALAPHARRVLVGGLGLGFTLREVLRAPGVEDLVVAEIEPPVVDWMRHGRIPGGDLLDDPRVEV